MSCELLWYPATPHIGLGHYYEPQTGLALGWQDENLAKELESARSAAKGAGKVLRNGFGRQHSVRYKGEVDVVTEVDGANLAKILSGRRKPSRVMLAKLEGSLAQFS
jgi:hypothetical protein